MRPIPKFEFDKTVQQEYDELVMLLCDCIGRGAKGCFVSISDQGNGTSEAMFAAKGSVDVLRTLGKAMHSHLMHDQENSEALIAFFDGLHTCDDGITHPTNH